jgi:hypothetical protein
MKDKFDVKKLKKKAGKKRLNSRAKGNRFENKVAKLLNERFNTKEFCRSPGSGAFATTHTLPEYLKIYGDLITPEKFKYIIECKKGYNDMQICDLLNDTSKVSEMIAQAFRDSQKSSKKFLLIMGQDRKNPAIITNDFDLIVRGDRFSGSSRGVAIVMYMLDDLLECKDSCFFE